MKYFYPVLYLCFLFGLLPFLGSCSEENRYSGTIEMNQLPGTAQSFLSNYFPGQNSGENGKNEYQSGKCPVALSCCFSR